MRDVKRSFFLVITVVLSICFLNCGRTNIKTDPKKIKDDFGIRIVKRAKTYLDSPYKYGGCDASGFDCSGLVYRVFYDLGVDLPRMSLDQAKEGMEIPKGKEKPGDLIFFRTVSPTKPSHVGIVTKKGTMIHAPSSGKRVMISKYKGNPYWEPKIHVIRRIRP